MSNSKIEAKRVENTDKLMEVASNKVVYLPTNCSKIVNRTANWEGKEKYGKTEIKSWDT